MGKFAKRREADGPAAALMRRVAVAARKRNAQLGLFDVDAIVHVFFDELAAELVESGRLWLPGLGVFTVRTRKARVITTLMGKPARFEIPERREVHFRASKALRGKL